MINLVGMPPHTGPSSFHSYSCTQSVKLIQSCPKFVRICENLYFCEKIFNKSLNQSLRTCG